MPPRKNMSVVKNNRKESSVEFDATYFKIHDDAIRLIECWFGASKEDRVKHRGYIAMMARKILDDVFELGKHIRIANAIYPKSELEFYERRKHMELAIYEIRNCYKSWRNSTRKDCNRCERTIKAMDSLFCELFPNIEEPMKKTRNDIINEVTKSIIEV